MSDTRIAIRCDGGAAVGAGHVGRCLPVARAFAEAGLDVTLVGCFDGLAAAMVDAAVAENGIKTSEPFSGALAGIAVDAFAAAFVDLYGVPEPEMCALASAMPLATMAEASRCLEQGIHVDYHLDRDGSEDTSRLLAGPAYVPVATRFAALDNPRREQVQRILLTLGGSEMVRPLALPLFGAVRRAFPAAEIVVAAGLPVPDAGMVVRLDPRAQLVDHVAGVDLAITGAGMTALELAAADIPFLALVLVDNQLRMVDGLQLHGVGATVDVREAIPEQLLTSTLQSLADVTVRSRLADAGRGLIDGRGAERIAAGLLQRWRLDVG